VITHVIVGTFTYAHLSIVRLSLSLIPIRVKHSMLLWTFCLLQPLQLQPLPCSCPDQANGHVLNARHSRRCDAST